MIDEKIFKQITTKMYDQIFDAFDDYDPDDVEADANLDNVSITFANGIKFIINRQTPVRQIWLATKKEGLHFTYNEENGQWIDPKSGEEFYKVFSKNVSEMLGKPFELSAE